MVKHSKPLTLLNWRPEWRLRLVELETVMEVKLAVVPAAPARPALGCQAACAALPPTGPDHQREQEADTEYLHRLDMDMFPVVLGWHDWPTTDRSGLVSKYCWVTMQENYMDLVFAKWFCHHVWQLENFKYDVSLRKCSLKLQRPYYGWKL